MREDFGYVVKGVSDHMHKELSKEEVHDIFKSTYLNNFCNFSVDEAHYTQKKGGIISADVSLVKDGKVIITTAEGNGRLDAVSNALKNALGVSYDLESYDEHALERGSYSMACSYVSIVKDGKKYWGAGTDNDIIVSSVKALVSAINRMM